MIQELTSCDDAADNALISVTETDETVLLEGTLFVELVSPYRFVKGYTFILCAFNALRTITINNV